MDDDVVAACSGTFRPAPPDATPRQRRLLRGFWVVWGVALLLWAVRQWVADGPAEAVDALLLALVLIVTGAVVERLGPVTRVDGAGLSSRTAFRESGSAPWADVVGFRPPGGFHEHWSAELRGGGVLELPGLPTDVAERLVAALPAPPSDETAHRTQRRTALPDVGGWDGPFHRSPRGR